MLADFFDTMGTMTAIGAEAGLLDEDGVPPEQPAHPGRRLARRGRRRCGRRLQQHLLHRVGLRCRRGRPHRPGQRRDRRCCSCWPRSSRRWSRSSPTRPPSPALVLVGFLMMQQVKNIDWDDVEIALPAFLTIVLMPFTYSISVGIGAGFIAYVLIKLVRGQGRRGAPAAVGGLRAVRRLLLHRPDQAARRRLTCDASPLGYVPVTTAARRRPTTKGAAHEHHAAGTPQGRGHRDAPARRTARRTPADADGADGRTPRRRRRRRTPPTATRPTARTPTAPTARDADGTDA